MEEIWKDIPDYEGIYQASNFGRVKRLARTLYKNNGWSEHAKFSLDERIKDIQTQKQGYSQVVLYKNGIGRTFRLNTLIARMFISAVEGKPYVNHIDGNNKNNRVDNLEWCTASENAKHAYKIGLAKHQTRKVAQIDENGTIICTFDSIKEASKTLKISKGNICSVCKGTRKCKAGGYYWRYV